MEKTDCLIGKLERNNVRVFSGYRIDESAAFYVSDGSSAYIAMRPDIPESKALSALAHEAGHHFTGLTKHKGRDEERANRWAVNELLAPKDIVEATIRGCQSYHELCDMLNLDEDFIRTAILVFRSIYGQGIELDGYYLHLYPIWVKELETGRIWPED